jgi:hypothetical protein
VTLKKWIKSKESYPMNNINTVLEYGFMIYCGAVLLNLLFIAYEIQSSDKPYEKTGDKEVDDLKEEARQMMVELKQPLVYVEWYDFIYPNGLGWRLKSCLVDLLSALGMPWFEEQQLFRAKALMCAMSSQRLRLGQFPTVGFRMSKREFIEGCIKANQDAREHYEKANKLFLIKWYNKHHKIPWEELFEEIDTDMNKLLLDLQES